MPFVTYLFVWTEVSIINVSALKGRTETTCSTSLLSVLPWSSVALDRPPLSSRAREGRQDALFGPENNLFVYDIQTQPGQRTHFFRLEHKFSYSSKHFFHIDVVLGGGLEQSDPHLVCKSLGVVRQHHLQHSD